MKRLALTALSALALLAAAGGALATDGDRPGATAADIDPARFTKKLDAAYGAYQRGLYRTALNLALERARDGDVPAQTLAAEILARGLGVPRDQREAAKWYERAAEGGDPEAQFQYALLLIDGRYVGKDEKQAFALMEAAAEAGNVLAQFNFAQMAIDRDPGPKGIERAIAYYERAAATGLADAQYAMAQVYANGIGGKPKDDARARALLTRAALQNYDTAQLDLGAWLIEGRGGPRDEKRGFRILKSVAEAGNVAAQARVAKLYLNGIGTEPDSIFAAAWYILARRAGLTDPQLDDFMNGLTDEEIRTALLRANRLR